MKLKILTLLVCFIAFTNCSLDSTSEDIQQYDVFFHLSNVNGGISGINENYSKNQVVWSFFLETNISGTLTVVNTISDESAETGLTSGTYDFYFENDNENVFIFINDVEIGSIVFYNEEMIIDQNIKTTGTGSDGYVYTFDRFKVAVN